MKKIDSIEKKGVHLTVSKKINLLLQASYKYCKILCRDFVFGAKSCAVHYSYDIHGNVKTLLQDNKKLYDLGVTNSSTTLQAQRYKRIDYEYDLISGNVNTVNYQQGQPDAFSHHYEYDADNRITNVYTSKYPSAKWTGIQSDPMWEQDAKYFYYLHGLMARVELGDEKVQAMDYAYTIQGWIKGVNSETLLPSRDMGKDGETSTNNVNKNIARDAFGYSLGYYNGDYKPIGNITSINNFIADKTGSDLMASRNDLFNGNISSMVTTITNLSGTALPNAMAYKYDQLNRIKEAKGFTNIDAVNNTWQGGSTYNGRYYNNYSFDANGNILTALVKNDAGAIIDDQTYNYQTINGVSVNNKLYTITDNATVTAGYDLPSTQAAFNNTLSTINTANNYGYSEIGELKFDKQDNITDIKRRVDGNITEITRTTGSGKTNLKFSYDALGKRTAKHKYTNAGIWFESEYYVRDASGNMMSTYKYTVDNQTQTASFKQTERFIYGSSLLGIDKTTTELIGAVSSGANFSRVLGHKQYSLQNHLGNDLVVVSDRKIPNDVTSDGVVDFYTADILLARDYGVYGEYLTNRVFNPNDYPNSFNGKRDDEELFGWQDYGYRNYLKGRRGFDRTDPHAAKYPMHSPYNAFNNNPIIYVDPDGKDWTIKTTNDNNGNQTVQLNLTAAVLNSSANSNINMGDFAAALKGQVETSYSIKYTKTVYESVIVPSGLDNMPSRILRIPKEVTVTVNVNVDVRVIKNESELKSSEHLVNIKDSKDLPGVYGAANKLGGMRVDVGDAYVPNIINGKDNNTLPHELGHTFGLRHIDKQSEGNFLQKMFDSNPQYMNAAEQKKNSTNSMFSGTSPYMNDKTSTKITGTQIETGRQAVTEKEVNKQ